MSEEVHYDWIVVSGGERYGWIIKDLVCHGSEFGFHHDGKEKP